MPPINDDDLMSAITTGMNEAGGAAPEETTDDTDTDTGNGASGDGASGEAGTDGGVASNESGADQAVDGGDATAGAEADAGVDPAKAGKPAGEVAGAEAAAKAGSKDKNPDGTDKQVKAPDPLNDPIPNALKGPAKERIQTLISTVKTTTTQRDEALAERDEIMGHIVDTGASPEEYGEALGVLKFMKSGDPTQLEQAHKYLTEKAAEIARVLGKPVPGTDMLAKHEDLQSAVLEGNMSQQHAEELAAARDARAIQAQNLQRQKQVQQQTQQEAEVFEAGRTALTAVGKELQADPHFKAKHAILKESLREAFTNMHPSKWAPAYKAAYAKLNLGPIAAPRKPGAPAAQPLRHKSPAGGATPAATSMLDAINSTLGRFPQEAP